MTKGILKNCFDINNSLELLNPIIASGFQLFTSEACFTIQPRLSPWKNSFSSILIPSCFATSIAVAIPSLYEISRSFEVSKIDGSGCGLSKIAIFIELKSTAFTA
jgi:hypothetical protein